MTNLFKLGFGQISAFIGKLEQSGLTAEMAKAVIKRPALATIIVEALKRELQVETLKSEAKTKEGELIHGVTAKFFSAACSGNDSVAPGWHGDFGVGLCGGSRGLAQPVSGKYMGKFFTCQGLTLDSVTCCDNSQDAGNAYGVYTHAMQFQVP